MPSPQVFKSLRVLDVEYAYLDSGPPASPKYTTWMLIHGMGFNGAVFEKLLPPAHAHNLRIVSIYRRGYPPSSLFQEEELTGIGFMKKIEEAEPFFRAQGAEIATFLVNFVVEQRIPVAVPNDEGGIALIGWSLGGIHVLALLAYLDELPEDAQSTIQKYLHTALCHDGNARLLGIPITPKHDITLWLEPDARKRFDAFFDWITGHYTHKSVTSNNIDDLEFNIANQEIPHSFHALPYAQRGKYTELEAFANCDTKLMSCDATVFAALTKRALFDKARAEKSSTVRVRFMSGGTTPGYLIWTLWMLREYTQSPPEEIYGSGAEKARDIKFVTEKEGNHFVFWDDPEMAIKQYSAAINL